MGEAPRGLSQDVSAGKGSPLTPQKPTGEQWDAFYKACHRQLVGTPDAGPVLVAAVEKALGETMDNWVASGKTLRDAYAVIKAKAA